MDISNVIFKMPESIKKFIGSNTMAIFDMDGVLINSLSSWREINKKFFEAHNIFMTEPEIVEFNKNICGLNYDYTIGYIRNNYVPHLPIDEVYNTITDMAIEEYTNNVSVNEEIISIIQFLNSTNIPVHICTANIIKLTMPILQILKDKFDIKIKSVVTSDLPGVKSNDKIILYQTLINDFGVDKDNIVIFEDSNAVLSWITTYNRLSVGTSKIHMYLVDSSYNDVRVLKSNKHEVIHRVINNSIRKPECFNTSQHFSYCKECNDLYYCKTNKKAI